MNIDIVDTELQLLSSLQHAATDVNQSLAEGLRVDDFYVDAHRRLFTAICDLTAAGDPVDINSLAPRMAGEMTFETLWGMLTSMPTSMHRRRLTALVIDESRRRGARMALMRATAALDAPQETWTETWAEAEPHLTHAQQLASRTQAVDRNAVMAEARALLGAPDLSGVAGPFPAWDRAARKLRKGELAVLAGRPGTGKSALALQYADAVDRSGQVSLIASLEMSEPELLARLAVQKARSSRESDAAYELDRINLERFQIITGRAASTISQIEGSAKLHAAKGNLGMLIIDYLQLVTPPADMAKSPREQQVAAMSRRFKLLAGEIGCPILLLAQLNRESEKEERRPRISDLRESGAIEQDADAVWLLHRENPEDTGRTVAVQLIQAKRRNWQPGIFMRLGFTGEIVTFNPLQP